MSHEHSVEIGLATLLLEMINQWILKIYEIEKRQDLLPAKWEVFWAQIVTWLQAPRDARDFPISTELFDKKGLVQTRLDRCKCEDSKSYIQIMQEHRCDMKMVMKLLKRALAHWYHDYTGEFISGLKRSQEDALAYFNTVVEDETVEEESVSEKDLLLGRRVKWVLDDYCFVIEPDLI